MPDLISKAEREKSNPLYRSSREEKYEHTLAEACQLLRETLRTLADSDVYMTVPESEIESFLDTVDGEAK